MSKILSDEDGDTIWNDPTPNIDDEIDRLMRIAEQAEGINGYGVTPAFVTAVKQLITDARVDEVERFVYRMVNTDDVLNEKRIKNAILDYQDERIEELKENKL